MGGGVELGDAANRILGGRRSGTIEAIITRQTKWRTTRCPAIRFQGEDPVDQRHRLGGQAVVLNLAIGQIRLKIGGTGDDGRDLCVSNGLADLWGPHTLSARQRSCGSTPEGGRLVDRSNLAICQFGLVGRGGGASIDAIFSGPRTRRTPEIP